MKMDAHTAGVVLPTKLLKQGSPEDVDLSLLCYLEEEKLPAFNCRACSYVKRYLGQGIRSSLWMPGMPRSPTLSAAGAAIYVAKQVFHSDRRCRRDRKLRIGCL